MQCTLQQPEMDCWLKYMYTSIFLFRVVLGLWCVCYIHVHVLYNLSCYHPLHLNNLSMVMWYVMWEAFRAGWDISHICNKDHVSTSHMYQVIINGWLLRAILFQQGNDVAWKNNFGPLSMVLAIFLLIPHPIHSSLFQCFLEIYKHSDPLLLFTEPASTSQPFFIIIQPVHDPS